HAYSEQCAICHRLQGVLGVDHVEVVTPDQDMLIDGARWKRIVRELIGPAHAHVWLPHGRNLVELDATAHGDVAYTCAVGECGSGRLRHGHPDPVHPRRTDLPGFDVACLHQLRPHLFWFGGDHALAFGDM